MHKLICYLFIVLQVVFLFHSFIFAKEKNDEKNIKRDEKFYQEIIDLSNTHKQHIQKKFLDSKNKLNTNQPADLLKLSNELRTNLKNWIDLENKLSKTRNILYQQLIESTLKRFSLSMHLGLGLYFLQNHPDSSFPALEISIQLQYPLFVSRDNLFINPNSILIGAELGYILSFPSTKEINNGQEHIRDLQHHQVYTELFLGYGHIFSNFFTKQQKLITYFQLGLGPYISLNDIIIQGVTISKMEYRLGISLMIKFDIPIQHWIYFHNFFRYRFILKNTIGFVAGIGFSFKF